MTKGGGGRAAQGQKLLDEAGADKASAKAVKMADAVEAPKATASKATTVGPGKAPAATSQAAVDKAMKPGGGGGGAPSTQAAAPAAPEAPEAKPLKPASGGGAAKPKPNAFIKIAKKVGSALKGIYDVVSNFIAKAGQY